MGKKSKILIVLLGLAAVVLIILLIVANKNKKEDITIDIPRGSLSADFFESQNTIYESSETLTKSIVMDYAPYSIDVPDSLNGVVGEGIIYNIDELYNLYLSECDVEEDIISHILQEYPQTVFLNADSKKCAYEEIYRASGYINGFAAQYIVGDLSVSDGKESTEIYIVAYILNFSDYYENQIIGVTTRVLSTESLSFAEQYAVSVVRTLQYDEKLFEGMSLRRPPVIEVEEPSEEYSESISEELSEEPMPEVPSTAIVQIEEITVPKDYQNLVMEYTWENDDTMIEAKLYSNGTKFSPAKYERGKAIFELGKFTAGSYQMEIRGYDYGKTSVEFIEQ